MRRGLKGGSMDGRMGECGADELQFEVPGWEDGLMDGRMGEWLNFLVD